MQGRIGTIAFGGAGVLRDGNHVIFIPFSAPGDLIEAQITDQRKRFAIGAIQRIIEPSPVRTEPLCQHFTQCGGCQFQHLKYTAQTSIKKQFISDALERVGGITDLPPFEVEGTDLVYGYRRHVHCRFHCKPGSVVLGYHSVDNQTLLDIQECPIFLEHGQPLFKSLRLFFSQLPISHKMEGSLQIVKSTKSQFLLAFRFQHRPSDLFLDALHKEIGKNSQWKGISIEAPGFKQTFGDILENGMIDGMQFSYSPSCFIQNHPSQSAAIYKRIADAGATLSEARVLDLFCGIGISSLLLARQGHKVLGVEWNRESIEFARRNADANKISAAFEAASCEEIIRSQKGALDLILLNPPRVGASDDVLTHIKRLLPERILYISCMPSTLARDVKKLYAAGYRVYSLKGYDMFPQTTHVETVVELKKSPARL